MDSQPAWRPSPIAWRERSTWADPLTLWLEPLIHSRRMVSAKREFNLGVHYHRSEYRDLFEELLKVDYAVIKQKLVDALLNTELRVFHGCRVEDVSEFLEHGLRLNDPSELEARARKIAKMATNEDRLLQSLEKFIENDENLNRDTGSLFVSLDDRELTGDCSHYALYGSEWILCALGWDAHSVLRKFGVPTILEINIPIRTISSGTLEDLSERLLEEWVRFSIEEPETVPIIDFGIRLRTPVASSQIVGHYHPKELTDVFSRNTLRMSAVTSCPSCAHLSNLVIKT